MDVMFEVPGSDIMSVHINEDVVRNMTKPSYVRNSQMDDSNVDENLRVSHCKISQFLKFWLS